jgi:hypothetical protein
MDCKALYSREHINYCLLEPTKLWLEYIKLLEFEDMKYEAYSSENRSGIVLGENLVAIKNGHRKHGGCNLLRH